MSDAELRLQRRNIRPTSGRLLVYRALERAISSLSLSDLEADLGTVDKSTIFRALNTFLEHHLVHTIDDGTGQIKYALCTEDCHCGEDKHTDLDHRHTHFYCETCHRTYCLHEVAVPIPSLPESFHLHSANYVLKGICPHCKPCTTSSALEE